MRNKLIDFYKINFKITQNNIITAQVQDISVDGEDQFLDWTPEFRIICRGRSLNDIDWTEIKECEYDNSSSILYVDDNELQVDRECPDLMYFVPDFSGNYDDAFDNIMKHFCENALNGKLI